MSAINEKPVGQSAGHPTDLDMEINDKGPQDTAQSLDGERSDEELSKDAQDGVRKAEAITQAWSKPHLYMAYIM